MPNLDVSLANCLRNGAIILDRYEVESCPRWIVLAVWKHEYVTWCVDKDGNSYWGHYHKSIDKASADYSARVARGY
jgi:hypothetical protein